MDRPVIDRQFAFRSLLEDHAAFFGGRKAYIDQIQQASWSKPGYIFLQGPSGFGKSALMSHIVQAPWMDTAYYFFNRHYSTPACDLTSEDTFLEVTCQQLAEIRDIPFYPGMNIIELRSLYIRALVEDSPKPFLLLLDGLDEAAFPLVNYFPGDLGVNVHILATARKTADRDWIADLKLSGTAVLELEGLVEDDVVEILRRAGAEAAALADDSEFVDSVLDISRRDPFYVRYLAEDIQAGLIGKANISEQPQGLTSYLDRWWDDLTESLDTGSGVVDIISLLFVALGPLTRSDLLACLKDNPKLAFSIDGVLDGISRFLVGSAEKGYQFTHPRFKEFLNETQKIPVQLSKEYRGRIMEFCHGWTDYAKPEEVPDYILKYFAHHVAELGDTSRFLPFLSPEWVQLKLERFHTHSALAEDLQHLIDVALESPVQHWWVLPNLLLKEGIIAERSENLPDLMAEVLAEAGDVDRALGIAQLIRPDLRADSKKAFVLARMAEVVARQGDPAMKERIETLALESARQTKDVPYRVKALTALARSQAKSNPDKARELLDEALEAVTSLVDNTSGKKSVSYMLVAEQLASLDANKALNALESALESVLEGEPIVETEPGTGLIISEIRAFDDLRNASINESVINILAEVASQDPSLAERGVSTVNKLQSRIRESAAFQEVTYREYIQPLFGEDVSESILRIYFGSLVEQHPERFDSIEEIMSQMSVPEEMKESAAAAIAQKLAETDTEKALAWASELSPRDRYHVLAQCAQQIGESDPQRLEEILEQLPANPVALTPLIDILEIEGLSDEWLSEVGRRIRQAAATSDLPPGNKIAILAIAAVALYEKDRGESERLIADALSELDEDSKPLEELRLRLQIAVRLSELGDDRAREIMAPTTSPDQQPEDTDNYAYTLAQAAKYIAPNDLHFAQELLQAAMDLAERPKTGPFAAISSDVNVATHIARTMMDWNRSGALELLRGVLKKKLSEPTSASYYFNWCVARFIPVAARCDNERVESIVQDHLSQQRVSSFCAIAEQVAREDKASAQRLLEAAIKDVLSGEYPESKIEHLGDVVRSAIILELPEAEQVIQAAVNGTRSAEPDEYGEKARALVHLADALMGARNGLANDLWTEALNTAKSLEEAVFRDPAIADVIEVRNADTPDDRLVFELAETFQNPYWHNMMLAHLAEWHAERANLDGVLRAMDRCREHGFKAWAFAKIAAAVPEDREAVRVELLKHAQDLIETLPLGIDLSYVLAEYGRTIYAQHPQEGQEAAERAAAICEQQVENRFGSKFRTLAHIALTFSQFDPLRAATMAEVCFEGNQTEVMPQIVLAALDRPDTDLDAWFRHLLMGQRHRSMNSQLVSLGSAVPIMEQLGGAELVARALEGIIDVTVLLE